MKKNNLLLIILSFVSVFSLSAQIDSIYYYNPDSTKEMFYVQKDMYSFRLANGTEFSLSSANPIVDEIQHLLKTPRKLNLIKFTSGVTEADIQTFIQNNLNIPEFEFAAKIISKDINSLTDYSQEKFLTTDDLPLVTFKDPYITQVDIDAFMSRNGLILAKAPLSGLSPNYSWPYEFRLSYSTENYHRTTIEVCKSIFENEHDIVLITEPSITYKEDQDDCVSTTELDYYAGVNQDKLWHIKNTANPIFNAEHGLDDADANICECWGEGYHGEEINIAVLDQGGFDFEHPDMQGQFVDGWDCVNDSAITGTIFLTDDDHGMSSASVIAAKANNQSSSNSNKNAVGVAFNSKIIPILRTNNTVVNERAIQQSIVLGADVISMSFGSNSTNPNWQADFKQAINGAYEEHDIFLVASTGNDDINVIHYPAAWPKVFGVGATDPNDLRGNDANSSQFGTWINHGSNFYNPTTTIDTLPYSVVAPGTRLMVAVTHDPLTSSPIQELFSYSGTSAATPVVSGIAAILLSKNPNLTPSELASVISLNADKVRPDVYDYNSYSSWAGYNNEMFYGRVNCPKSLTEVDQINPPFPLSVGDFIKTIDNVFLSYLNNNELQISIKNEVKNQDFTIKIFAINGQLIQENNFINKKIFNVNISELSKAIYFIRIDDNNNKLSKSLKFIK